ncbi:MAG TPA: hypothetical protein VJH03_00595 [Blastocatellia bacterium]|nr:hypothetical protein [Blastocatellia bacterium]
MASLQLPTYLSESIRQAIEESRRILDLKDNWDDEGSPAYEESTWARALDFLTLNAITLWRHRAVWVCAPRILPGPQGSIDLHWRTGGRELLVNIPASLSEPADFYGDNGSCNVIKGKLDTSEDNEWILLWLTR